MLRSTARSKVTWGAVVAALVVGLALLLMLTSQGIHPRPAQAAQQQTAPKTVLEIGDQDAVEFRTLDEAVSSIELPDQRLPEPQPVSIVLVRKADSNLVLSAWHQQARQFGGGGASRRDVTLTYFNRSGQATMRLVLVSAWPAEYRLAQQDGQLVEEVTLSADDFIRESPQQ